MHTNNTLFGPKQGAQSGPIILQNCNYISFMISMSPPHPRGPQGFTSLRAYTRVPFSTLMNSFIFAHARFLLSEDTGAIVPVCFCECNRQWAGFSGLFVNGCVHCTPYSCRVHVRVYACPMPILCWSGRLWCFGNIRVGNLGRVTSGSLSGMAKEGFRRSDSWKSRIEEKGTLTTKWLSIRSTHGTSLSRPMMRTNWMNWMNYFL